MNEKPYSDDTCPGKVIFDLSRIRLYACFLLSIAMIRGFWLLYNAKDLVDIRGKPIGADFITFWSAGHLALEGRPEAAFLRDAIVSAQQYAVPGNEAVFLWHYPPTFMLIAAALASIPYLVSYIAFIGASLAFYLYAVRKLLVQPYALLLLLGFPAVFLTIVHGQNSLLSTALLACAFYYLKPKPVLAGIFIGLLAFKPQFGVLIPLVLIASQQWKTFFSASVTTSIFVGLSIWVFGPDLWLVFFENMQVVEEVMSSGQLHWDKMPSLYVTLKMFGFSNDLAKGIHWLGALGVVGVLVRLWYQCGSSNLACAALVPAMLLILPYLFDYELTLLAIPLAFLAIDMAQKGGERWEKSILIVAYIAPLVLAGIGQNLNIQIGYPVILALFVLACRRAFLEVRLV